MVQFFRSNFSPDLPKVFFPFLGACFFHFFLPHSQRGCKRPLLLPFLLLPLLLVLFATFDLLSKPFPSYEATGPFSLSPRPKLQRQGLSVLNLFFFLFQGNRLTFDLVWRLCAKRDGGERDDDTDKMSVLASRKAGGIFSLLPLLFLGGGGTGRKFRFNELC